MISNRAAALLIFAFTIACTPALGAVQPGDVITATNADKVADLLSPGNLMLVKQGMMMKIVAPERLEWPPPYRAATEKYASQVKLGADEGLRNYVAGQPFPLLDPNDPHVAVKVMWNFSFSPLYTDDVDLRDVEVASYAPGRHAADPIAHFTLGHVALYNAIGRTEIAPVPTDPDAAKGIRYRFAAYPFLEPAEIRGFGFVRYRNIDPNIEDNSWFYNPTTRRTRRVGPDMLSEAFGTISGAISGGSTSATNLDPDSYYGFAAKIEDYSYKLIGEKSMLACVHAQSSPAKPCPFDGSRTICPENWEMRRLYVIEATARRNSWFSGPAIPKRILYIDSEGWLITASDQYDRGGQLWKTIATFNAYRDRPVPDARVAIYPFKRMFETAMVDENVQDGFSTVVYAPGRESQDHECWYINMGIATKAFFEPNAMARVGH